MARSERNSEDCETITERYRMKTFLITLAIIVGSFVAITLLALWAVLLFKLVEVFQDYLDDKWE